MDTEFNSPTTQSEPNTLPVSEKQQNVSALRDLASSIKANKEKGVVVLVVGAWGVGKTTLGKTLSSFSDGVYLDGDKQGDFEMIKERLHGNISPGSYTVVGKSFAEKWAPEETIRQLQQDGKLVIVNLTANEDTRMENMYMRAEGYKPHSNYDVERTRKRIQESPDYRTPLADFVLNFNKEARPTMEEVSELLRSELSVPPPEV
ncbi:hypothetical protein KC726_01595 [Candidatus Woesebacteria bacterium]|nr:hypothetical protein [Candidatus Woesebacteria bacterium]